MAHPVADRAFIAQRKCRYVIERILFRNTPPALADDDGYLAFIIELRAFRRTHQRALMPGEGAGKPDEERGIGRRSLPILVFLVSIWKIDTDTDDLSRRRNWNLIGDGRKRNIGGKPCRLLRKLRQHTGLDHLTQGRPARPMARRKIDNTVLFQHAIVPAPAGRKTQKLHHDLLRFPSVPHHPPA